MGFTHFDCVYECLLKVLVSLPISKANKEAIVDKEIIIKNWLERLQVEGPEYARIIELTRKPIDDFQATLIRNELKANILNQDCREKVEEIVKDLENNPPRTELEKKFQIELAAMLTSPCDKMGLEEYLRQLPA